MKKQINESARDNYWSVNASWPTKTSPCSGLIQSIEYNSSVPHSLVYSPLYFGVLSLPPLSFEPSSTALLVESLHFINADNKFTDKKCDV